MTRDEALEGNAHSRRPKLLMVSPEAPFPMNMASKVRVFNILRAASRFFQTTFVAQCDRTGLAANRERLEKVADRVVLLPPINRRNVVMRALHKGVSTCAAGLMGLPDELYYSSFLNLSSGRIHEAVDHGTFDVVLYEYWFSAGSIGSFQKAGAACVLDTHDVLWRKRATRAGSRQGRGGQNPFWRDRRYQALEEDSWRRFDGIIAINPLEAEYIRTCLQGQCQLTTAAMGADLAEWAYGWQPAAPPRVVFYGALSGPENVEAAVRSARGIMPLVWAKVPEAELWLVGANPTPVVQALASDRRVVVTGTVERTQPVLGTGSVLLCPLTGRYGFRSRLIEAMAVGLPLVASEDAVWGMELRDGYGLAVRATDASMAEAVAALVSSPALAAEQSHLARRWVEEHFSFDATYGRIASFLLSCATGTTTDG